MRSRPPACKWLISSCLPSKTDQPLLQFAINTSLASRIAAATLCCGGLSRKTWTRMSQIYECTHPGRLCPSTCCPPDTSQRSLPACLHIRPASDAVKPRAESWPTPVALDNLLADQCWHVWYNIHVMNKANGVVLPLLKHCTDSISVLDYYFVRSRGTPGGTGRLRTQICHPQ